MASYGSCIWDGVSAIDPLHLPINRVRPTRPHRADHCRRARHISATSGLRLPARLRDLTIDYTALSLVAPEKVRFRFKLEGQDPDWREVLNIRRVQYSNLAARQLPLSCHRGQQQRRLEPGRRIAGILHRTRVLADELVRAVCVAAFLLVLWALYRLRLHQITRAFNARLEERVAERTRIARDLHDTLLQSFQGLLLRFQTVYELLPNAPGRGRGRSLGARLIRRRTPSPRDGKPCRGCVPRRSRAMTWPRPSRRFGEELATQASGHTPVGLQVALEGTARPLQPIVRDEIYRIASEALRNALRHAGAKADRSGTAL